MRKIHATSLKVHTIYSVSLATLFVVTSLLIRDIVLSLAMLALVAYVIGNGIIHGTKNTLTRDTIVEYILVSIIVVVLLLTAVLTR